MQYSDIILTGILIVLVALLFFYIKSSKRRTREMDAIGKMAKAWTEVFSGKHMALLIEEMKAKMDDKLVVIDGKAVVPDEEF